MLFHCPNDVAVAMSPTSFLPMFPDEVKKKGWSEIDVLIISGEPYVDHPSYGVAVIGRILEARGYKVGIIAQPDWNNVEEFKRLGRPRLCACVTAGNVDSMIMNYTANKRLRRQDPKIQGYKDHRPDRATIVYANRLRAAFKNIPIVIGGIEASMRRLAHYDYWDNAPRRSLLIDAKADLLIYGMGDRSIVEVADRLNKGEPISSIRDVRGTVVKVHPVREPSYLEINARKKLQHDSESPLEGNQPLLDFSNGVKKDEILTDAVFVPSFEEIKEDLAAFNKAFRAEYENMNPYNAKTIVQAHADQCVVQLPPALPLSMEELDATYALPYVRAWHPFYDQFGGVQGFETVRWSITAVRGCPGECSFCGLSMNQGRIVQSRSSESILAEAKMLAQDPDFKGTITDIGGPTANLYGAFCRRQKAHGPCADKQCLMPEKCLSLEIPYEKTLALYEAIRKIPNVKHVFVASGLRYDLLLEPEAEKYLRELCTHYISGQMKVAPEHTDDEVLAVMNKPSYKKYEEFVKKFERINAKLDKRVYLVNYFISAHPGSRLENALSCATKLLSCGIRPEQIQDFLPLPMTVSSAIFYTGVHPLTGEKVFVAKNQDERAYQRALVQSQNANNRPLIKKALQILGKEHLAGDFGVYNRPLKRESRSRHK